MGDLSEHFSKWEFACKCGCGFDSVTSKLIEALEYIRAKAGGPIRITSGCRCADHNKAVGGAKYSRHVTGEAADIQVEGGWRRHAVAKAAFEYAEGVGIAKTFIHVDMHYGSEECPRPSAWSY